MESFESKISVNTMYAIALIWSQVQVDLLEPQKIDTISIHNSKHSKINGLKSCSNIRLIITSLNDIEHIGYNNFGYLRYLSKIKYDDINKLPHANEYFFECADLVTATYLAQKYEGKVRFYNITFPFSDGYLEITDSNEFYSPFEK